MLELRFDHNSIKVLRKELGLTQEEFAKKLGNRVTKQLVSQWENAEQTPQIASLLNIVNKMNVPMNIFFKPIEYHGNNCAPMIDPS